MLWLTFVVSLVAHQSLATQVTYQTSQAASSASQGQKQLWSWNDEDLMASASNQGNSFVPSSFSDGSLQNSNVQSGSSGVAKAFVDQSSRPVRTIKTLTQMIPKCLSHISSNVLLQMETIIEDILISNRQGRNIEGYDVIYSDPAIKSALQVGNDTIARSYIRDKLCGLGLMQVNSAQEVLHRSRF